MTELLSLKRALIDTNYPKISQDYIPIFDGSRWFAPNAEVECKRDMILEKNQRTMWSSQREKRR